MRDLLKKYQIRPSKRLGQNFLIDKGVIKKIIEAAQLSPNDIVLEIGPGIGSLTIELAKKVKKVIAIEKDPKMCEILKDTLKDFDNIIIIQGDILKLDVKNSKFKIRNSKQIPNSKFQIPKKYKVVANIPYYLTSPLIRKFLEEKVPPKLMVLMVQKEVAQRICPRPPTSSAEGDFVGRRPKLKERRRGKTPKMNLLAVSVQFYAKPEIISFVSKKSFWPSPRVDSAIIKITPTRQRTDLCQTDRGRTSVKLFFRIVKAGFSQPRKQLINNFSKGLKSDKKKIESWLLKNNIRPTQRAETLTVENWINLSKSFNIN